MDLQQRLQLLPNQARSYIEGTIECIHDQWVFFDEQDEATSLKELTNQTFEILIQGKWMTFQEINKGVAFGHETYTLRQGDRLRVEKPLLYVYREWLTELSDEALNHFVSMINDVGYSIYDCIYCYNHLFLQVGKEKGQGVNFLIFDNEVQICAVQHHFDRKHTAKDRFELTLNNGARRLLMNTP
ncbi:DUF2777 family protein [Bacillus salitolerans]|uniref:DUF2777 family protein n=1 Tax=Bacillus salitolerans TaxID=1437434 RepID=A0ABW4LMR7_9BACI